MRIQHNIMAMNSYRNFNNNTNALSSNLEKLSSGYRINRAGDDAAGLAISEKMRAQITGLDAAQKNVNDGISLVKTAEGALQEVQDMLNRMVYLAEQSANGTYDDNVDRAALQEEVDALMEEIDRIADSSNFNGQKLLNGDLTAGATYHFMKDGATAAAADMNLTIKAGAYETAGGTIKNLTFEFATGTSAKATYSSGKVKIYVKAGTATAVGADASASSIQTLVRNLGVLTAGVTDYEAINKALKSVTVSGDTIKLGKGVTGLATTTKTADAVYTGEALTLQIGDTSDSFNQLAVGIDSMKCENILAGGTISIADIESAQKAVDSIKNSINQVSAQRGKLGAIQNRLEHTANNLSVMEENIQNAESTIRDTDIADEMTAYTKNNILLQSAQAMLAQANQVPQGVLQLLQ